MPITIFPPIQSAAAAAPTLPPNAAQELNGQLQKIADLMMASLHELKVISTSIAMLNDPEIDPQDIREDQNLSAQ